MLCARRIGPWSVEFTWTEFTAAMRHSKPKPRAGSNGMLAITVTLELSPANER